MKTLNILFLAVALTFITGCGQIVNVGNVLSFKGKLSDEEKEEITEYAIAIRNGLKSVDELLTLISKEFDKNPNGETKLKVMILIATMTVMLDNLEEVEVPVRVEEAHYYFQKSFDDFRYITDNGVDAFYNNDLYQLQKADEKIRSGYDNGRKGASELEKLEGLF